MNATSPKKVEVRPHTTGDDRGRRLALLDALAFSNALPATLAGALTVAELALAGMPALLVPYPFAADDHQAANARALEEAGATVAVK